MEKPSVALSTLDFFPFLEHTGWFREENFMIDLHAVWSKCICFILRQKINTFT